MRKRILVGILFAFVVLFGLQFRLIPVGWTADGDPVYSGSNVTELDGGNWKTFYTNGSGDVQELALGASAKVLTAGGASSAPTWEALDSGSIWINVADYDEGTDTLNIQAAVDDAIAINGKVYIPDAVYTLTSVINITDSIEIAGDGTVATIIQTASTTSNIFYINTPSAVIIRNMWIRNTGAGTPSSGAGILVEGGATHNTLSRFKNLKISGMYIGIDFVEAAIWTLSDSYIVSNIFIGVRIQNTYTNDAGDSTITRCVFDNTDLTGTYAIRQFSSGGLRLINNKILFHEFGYSLEIDNGVATSIVLIEGNSMEKSANALINIAVATGNTFARIVIIGNQLKGGDAGSNGRPIIVGNNGNVNHIVINSNFIELLTGDYAILMNRGTYFSIIGNTISGDGTDVGIGINAACANGVISGNTITNFGTAIENNSTTVTEIQSSGGAVGIGGAAEPGVYQLKVHGLGRFTDDLSSAGDIATGDDLSVTDKLTVGGATDPPAVLFDAVTRQSTIDLTRRSIPPNKLNGAMMFFNSETNLLEYFIASEGEFRNMNGDILATVDPITETFETKDRYYLFPKTGEVRVRKIRKDKLRYIVKPEYTLDADSGEFIDKETGEKVKKEKAVKKVKNNNK